MPSRGWTFTWRALSLSRYQPVAQHECHEESGKEGGADKAAAEEDLRSLGSHESSDSWALGPDEKRRWLELWEANVRS